MKEGCWGDDPGEGLTEIMKFYKGKGGGFVLYVRVGGELAYLGGVLP